MRTFEQWMSEYAVSHLHPKNQLIHQICVPLIMLTVIGFFWLIPTPQAMHFVSPWLNWATIFVVFCLLFYLSLNFMMFLGMLLQTALMLFITQKLQQAGILLPFCVGVFIISWIFQFIGHKIEGKKPSFFQDLAFLLIGPLWVQRFFYKKMGLNI